LLLYRRLSPFWVQKRPIPFNRWDLLALALPLVLSLFVFFA
jgi:hypothetical protein